MFSDFLPADEQAAIPLNVILDKDQVVRYNQAGGMSQSTLRTKVNNQLEKDPVLEY